MGMSQRLGSLGLVCALGFASPGTATEYTVYADPSATSYSCGALPTDLLAKLPYCASSRQKNFGAYKQADGYWYGKCTVIYGNVEGTTETRSFIWWGLTGYPVDDLDRVRPNSCQCESLRVSVKLGCGDIADKCTAETCTSSPIVVNLAGPIKLAPGPVNFDIDGDGDLNTLGWVSPSEPVEFLGLDRNENGLIDNGRELFGTATPGSLGVSGYVALKEYDSNSDGWVTAGELPRLLLWRDRNQDALSSPDELRSAWSVLSAVGVEGRTWSRVDQYGNRFGFRGTALQLDGKETITVDVFFVTDGFEKE